MAQEKAANEVLSLIRGSLLLGSPRFGGLILHGPSGVGKTKLIEEAVSCISDEAKVHRLNFTTLFGKSYGSVETSILSFFEGLDLIRPSIIICDDLESIALQNTRGVGTQRAKCLIFQVMDDLHMHDRPVIFVASCRDLSLLDRGVFAPGRIEVIIEITPPDFKDRCRILKEMTSQMSGDTAIIEYVARRTHGYLGSSLKRFCGEVVVEAMKRGTVVEPDDFKNALRATPHPSGTSLDPLQSVALEQHSIESLGGMTAMFERLRMAVVEPLKCFANSQPAQDDELLRKLGVNVPRGVLISGPSGCGKTALALALAHELQGHARFINISCTSLVHAEVGSSEKRLSKALSNARLAAPALVLLDQIDAIARRRNSSIDSTASSTMDRILSLLLVELDGAAQNGEGVVVVATTQEISSLEPALLRPGRLDQHITLGLPSFSDRVDILNSVTHNIPLLFDKSSEVGANPGSRDQLFKKLAMATPGWSGAELSQLCQEAAIMALRESSGAIGVSEENFNAALRVHPRRV